MNASQIARVLGSAHNEDIFYDYDEFGDVDNFFEDRLAEVQDAMKQGADLIQELRALVIIQPIDVECIRELLR